MTRDEALRVLGLKPDASRSEIQVAYRELAQMLHPDKFADNKKLRARAEQQMRSVNEARDTLLKDAGAHRPGRGTRSSSHHAAASGARTRRTMTPDEIAFEAEARAHAAETARLTVTAQVRTMRERRSGMTTVTVVAALVMLLTYRMSGIIGGLAFSTSSMLVVWGIVDIVSLSNQNRVLRDRAAELQRQRDAARKVAQQARKL